MTDLAHLEAIVEAAWEDRARVSAATHGEVRKAVDQALALLDSGRRGLDHTSMAEEGGAPVLPPQRQ